MRAFAPKGLFALLACCCLALCASALRAGPQDATEEAALRLLEEAGRRSADIQSLSADFVQEKTMAVLARPLQSEGYFCLRRAPAAHDRAEKTHSLLWAYMSPTASGFVYKDGRGDLWEGDPARTRPTGERESAAITAVIRHVLDWVQIDAAALRETYRLERLPTDEPALALFPRRRSFFSRLEARFAPDLRGMRQLTFVEHNGDTVRITFSHIHGNKPLPARCGPIAPPDSDGRAPSK